MPYTIKICQTGLEPQPRGKKYATSATWALIHIFHIIFNILFSNNIISFLKMWFGTWLLKSVIFFEPYTQ
jgi:hypothetical protein